MHKTLFKLAFAALALFLNCDAMAQSTESAKNVCVQGNIMDAATKNKLNAVQVIVKGTTQGTTSNSDGSFLIYADNGDTLVFSTFGYNSFEMVVSEKNENDVYLIKNEVSTTTIKTICAVIYYPLTNDTKFQSDIQTDWGRLYIYPLLVLNNVIIRDSAALAKFRNTIKYTDIKKTKHLSKPEAEKLGIRDIPKDGVLFVNTKRGYLIDLE